MAFGLSLVYDHLISSFQRTGKRLLPAQEAQLQKGSTVTGRRFSHSRPEQTGYDYIAVCIRR